MPTTTGLPTISELCASEQPRCLGCAAPLPSMEWEHHGTTCRPYYGTGRRVDYADWCALVERYTDEPLFSRWADGMAQAGIPSRGDGTERVR